MRLRPRSRIILLTLLLFCSSSLFAQAKPQFPKYTAHVNDFSNVIDGNTKYHLETVLTNFEKLTGAQIAVVTMPTIGDQVIEEYANGLYRAWGIGAKTGPNKEKGALLLILTQDRRSRMEVGYGLEGDLPDGLAGEMLRRMRPSFQAQKWSEGINVGVHTLVDTLAVKWNVNVEGIDRSYAYSSQQGEPEIQISPAMIIFGVIFLLFLLFIMSRSGRGGGGRGGSGRGGSGWWAAPLILHQGGGGFGGSSWGSNGGWGGSSGGGGGGGSWGGFGGGSSGGGGASDSW